MTAATTPPLDPAWQDRIRDAILTVLVRGDRRDEPDLDRFVALQHDYPRREGKGLRGRLALASAVAHGGSAEEALPVAAALELFQNWVLVHDDVEDDSDERRGAPALHRTVGPAIAINVGDAMHVAMWDLLIGIRADWRDAVLREFLATIRTTAEGQHLDLTWVADGRFAVDREAYLGMVERKTATYTVVAPLRLGAYVAGRTPHPQLTAAGRVLGRAFQIRDDVLNLTPDPEGGYGKEFAGDLYEGKRTLVLAIAFERLADRDAERLRSLLGRPRAEILASDVAEALALLERCGAVQEAQRIAERDARDGLAGLRQALADAPNREAADAIVALVETLATRDR